MSTNRKGFTLLELLVVIAIICILASAIVFSVRGIQRQARNTKCRANLKNLHAAVVEYLADNKTYPIAGSYAMHDKWNHGGGSITEKFIEFNGWVTWVKGNSSEPQKHDDFGSGVKKTPAKLYKYQGTGCGGNAKCVKRSIMEGSLFNYVGKSVKCYGCPELEKEGGIRTYAMNKYLRSRLNPRIIGGIRPQDIAAPSYDPEKAKDAGKISSDPGWINCGRDQSHTALFVENAVLNGECAGEGKEGDVDSTAEDIKKRKDYNDDALWDYETEKIGFWHRQSGDMCGHVVFMDGHVEAISKKMTESSLDSLCLDLGRGSFDPNKYETSGAR